jgi:hypothetical protein
MFWLLMLPLVSLAIDSLVVQGNNNGNDWPNPIFEGSSSFDSHLLQILEQWDVVEVMKFTGHGEGLDEKRMIQLFGEDEVRMLVHYSEGTHYSMANIY